MDCRKKGIGDRRPSHFGSDREHFEIVADAAGQMCVERTRMNVRLFYKFPKAIYDSIGVYAHADLRLYFTGGNRNRSTNQNSGDSLRTSNSSAEVLPFSWQHAFHVP
jgi:hypothetical protein